MFNEKDLIKFLKQSTNIKIKKEIELKQNYFSNNFKRKCLEKERIEEEILVKMEKNAKGILNEFRKSEKMIGIMYGKIQSGKTLNFLSLIACGFDEDYDISIFLNSSSKLISEQNEKRTRDYLTDDIGKKIKFITIGEKGRNTIKEEVFLDERWISNKKKIIIIVPKHQRWLTDLSQFIDHFSKERKFLIVDDEADQASLNNNTYKKDTDPSKINGLISEIRDKIPLHDYVCVTATPYANILLKDEDKMSPSFIRVIHPGKNYYGLNEFWNQKNGNHERAIKIIEKKDTENLCSKQYFHPSYSLEKAISTFFVGASLLNWEEENYVG